MDVMEAIKRAEQTQEVKGYKSQGYFLNSGTAIFTPGTEAKEWIVTYYNEAENKVLQATVSDSSVGFKEPATPINPTKIKLDVTKIKTKSDNILKKATKEFEKEKHPIAEIIMSVQTGEDVAWHVNFVTKTLFIVTVVLSAKDGKVLSMQKTSLSK